MSIDIKKYEAGYVLRPIKRALKFGIYAIVLTILLFAPDVRIAVTTAAILGCVLFVANTAIALYRNNKYKPFGND